MSPTETTPYAEGRSDDEHYLVKTRPDILAVLRAIATHKVPVRVQFAGRPSVIEASLLLVKPQYEELVFDASGVSNRMFAESENQLVAEATYDYIHVRFTGEHVEAVTHHGKPAFRCCIPKSLARTQRRGSARFQVPSANPPVVRYLQDERGPEKRLRVMDISYGGVSLILEDPMADIATGTKLTGCKLELPKLGAVSTNLEVVYTDEMNPQSTWRRIGCRFSGLGVLSLERVRDYVAVLERDHLNSAKPDRS